MRTLIVDDEKLGQERLVELLKEAGVEKITTASNFQDALRAARDNVFDLAFLDIEMPGMNGLDLAQRLIERNGNLFVVFQTAHENYAKAAFDVGGQDYLLKPVSVKDIDRVLTRVRKFQSSASQVVRFLAKRQNRFFLLRPEDIYYVKAELTEAHFRFADGTAYVRRKIYELEEILAPYGFFRVHRSYLVNLNKVRELRVVEQSKFEMHFREIDDIVTSSKDGAKMLREYLETRVKS